MWLWIVCIFLNFFINYFIVCLIEFWLIFYLGFEIKLFVGDCKSMKWNFFRGIYGFSNKEKINVV